MVTSWVKCHNEHSQIMHEQLSDWLKNHAGVIENLDDPSTVRHE